jgi:hypothetical protein
MRQALICLCLACPAALTAQDLSPTDLARIAEYQAAFAAFGIGDMSYDWVGQVAYVDGMLTDIAGAWTDAGRLSAGPDYPAHMHQEACARVSLVVERSGDLDFNLIRQSSNGRTLTAHHQFLGSRTFQVSVDRIQLQEYLGLPEDQRPHEMAYRGGQHSGYVEVFHPSPSILIIQPAGALADIYIRCG